jgi:hypothetical protein
VTPWNKFLQWGLCQNRWGWFHALAGGIGYLIFTEWLFNYSAFAGFIWVLLLATLWEAVEWGTNTAFYGGLNQNYGTNGLERFLYDAAGDILLAISVALLVILG